MSDHPVDPHSLRIEAGDIDIGAPDGAGYAAWLRACADRIEQLEAENKALRELSNVD